MLNRKFDWRPYLILVVLWMTVTIGNWAALSGYRCPWPHPTWGCLRTDIEKIRMDRSLSAAINSGGRFRDKLIMATDLLKTPLQRPRMVHLIAALGDSVFGEKYSRIIISSMYYLILILGTYFFSRKFYGKKIGMLSAALVSSYPEIFHFSKTYELDFPLTAFFIFTMYLLINTKNFRSSMLSVIFGIFLGIGILIKGSILLFLITPFLFSLYYAFRDYKGSGYKLPKMILNILIAVFISAAISSLWWAGNFNAILFKFPLYLSGKVKALMSTPYMLPDVPTIFFSKILYNIFLLVAQVIKASSVELFSLFIVFVFFFLKKKPRNNILIFSLLVPLIILYFSALKTPRYFMPLLPLFAIVISAGIFEIRNARLKRITIALACVIVFNHLLFYMFFNPENKMAVSKNHIYAKCSEIAEKFLHLIEKSNSKPAFMTFISEASNRDSEPMVIIQYFMEKQRGNDIILDFGLNNIDKSNFILLLFDRKYYFRVAAFLNAGREGINKRSYLNLCNEYLISDRSFCMNLMNPKTFNKYLYNIQQKVRNSEVSQFEIFEKLLVLEAIKKGLLSIKEVSKGRRWLARDISIWSDIYNHRGTEGLIQELTITYPELRSWLETGVLNKPLVNDVRWRWLYRQLTVNKFVIIGHEEIQQLGIDFYLLERAGNNKEAGLNAD